ncbi:MAG: regulator of protease activity HflC (stomatin/prohibitin superfamily) [Pseudoalteromonas tetraodonis]|jgi:regulator of protease activity HflC (stomatin/prohibitin superfamily)
MTILLTAFLSVLLFPFTFIFGWVIVHPQEEKIILYWGKFVKILDKPGLYFITPWGRKVIKISVKQQTIDIAKTTVADGNGNPIIIGGVCTYKVTNSDKAALEVEEYHTYLKTQAMAVLKQVASQYPYESKDGHSLKSEAVEVGQEMVKLLNTKVEPAGVHVEAYELADLTYAPEIAQSMLVRQQAQALVDARKIIAEGAVEIVDEAVTMLDGRGYKLDERTKSRLVSSLLVVICGEGKVQPTYSVKDGGSDESAETSAAMLEMLEKIAKHTTPK